MSSNKNATDQLCEYRERVEHSNNLFKIFEENMKKVLDEEMGYRVIPIPEVYWAKGHKQGHKHHDTAWRVDFLDLSTAIRIVKDKGKDKLQYSIYVDDKITGDVKLNTSKNILVNHANDNFDMNVFCSQSVNGALAKKIGENGSE